MNKKDFLDLAEPLEESFEEIIEDSLDYVSQLKWIGNVLGLLRNFRPELITDLRNRNFPLQSKNWGSLSLNLNAVTFMQDAYIALCEGIGYAESLKNDDDAL